MKPPQSIISIVAGNMKAPSLLEELGPPAKLEDFGYVPMKPGTVAYEQRMLLQTAYAEWALAEARKKSGKPFTMADGYWLIKHSQYNHGLNWHPKDYDAFVAATGLPEDKAEAGRELALAHQKRVVKEARAALGSAAQKLRKLEKP